MLGWGSFTRSQEATRNAQKILTRATCCSFLGEKARPTHCFRLSRVLLNFQETSGNLLTDESRAKQTLHSSEGFFCKQNVMF